MSKFWLSSSLRSLHNQNPSPKEADIFGSPTRRPEQNKKTALTKTE